MISVPELIVASSMPRLVHDSAHHLYESWSELNAEAARVPVALAEELHD